MLREHINDIMIRWSPKVRRGSLYDPTIYLETPEQARKLIKHLSEQLANAKRARNAELIAELEANLERVETLSRDFFRWERNNERNLQAQEMREIKKMPIGL